MKKWYKIGIFMILVITILVLNHVFGWSKYLMAQENIDMLKNMVKENFLLASLIYIGSTVIASVLLAVPGVTFAIIAGFLFGPWIGTLLCSIAATLGAVFSFIVGRFFLKDSIKPMAVKKKWLFAENGYADMFVLMITRLIPVFPYNLQNFAYGTTDMKLSKYTIGTFIFIVPGTAMYTVGAAGFADEKNRIIYIAAAILIAVVVSIIGYLLKKRYIKTGENIEQRSEA